MTKKCIDCVNLMMWCQNVWVCKKKKNTVDQKKIRKETDCKDWRNDLLTR